MGVKLAIYIEAEAHQERERMPGNFRQRIRTAISSLSTEPRPSASQPLDVADIQVPAGMELRRLRIDPWRLVYAIHEEEGWVWILAIRRRPPYDYEDLVQLLRRVEKR